jgi:hypothetical protein
MDRIDYAHALLEVRSQTLADFQGLLSPQRSAISLSSLATRLNAKITAHVNGKEDRLAYYVEFEDGVSKSFNFITIIVRIFLKAI